MKTFYLNDTDYTKYLTGIPALSTFSGDYGQVTVASTPTLSGLNTTGIWSSHLPHSILYGGTPIPIPVRIEEDGLLLFEGNLTGAQTDEQTGVAQLILQGRLQQALDSGCVYISSADATPATIFMELCVLYGIQCDLAISGASNFYYNNNGLFVVVAQAIPTGSLLDMFTALAEIGCAKVYETTNGLAFEAFQLRADGDPLYTFTNSDINRVTLWSSPSSELLQKEKSDGYSVTWANGYVSFPDNVEGLAVKQISAGLDTLVTITTLVGADFCGANWNAYLNRAQNKVRFMGPAGFAAQLPMGAYIHLYNSRWDYTTKIDITDLEFDGSAGAFISGVTR